MHLRGQRLVVTGASGLLGPHLVEALLALGAEVIAVGRRKTRLDALRARVRHHARLEAAECDLTDGEGVRRLAEAVTRVGDVHGVVHAVGAYVEGPFERGTEAVLTALFDANLRAAAFVASAFAPALLARGEGRFVFVGSEAALTPSPGRALYGASKAALHHLAASLDAEWRARGVRVDVVVPGPLGEGLAQASPPAVARAVAWLLSADARGTGGSSIRVPARSPDPADPG